MAKLVVLDDHEVLDRVEGWLKQNEQYELELDRVASQPIAPDGWSGIKQRIGELSGRTLIFLDLRLRLEGATRKRLRHEFPDFPVTLSEPGLDGYAVANLILQNEKLEGSVVVLNSTIGVGDDLMRNLANVANKLDRHGQIRFVPARTALSVSAEAAAEILRKGAREFFGEPELVGETPRPSEPSLGHDAFKDALREVYADHSLYETDLVRRLSQPDCVTLEELRSFAVLYYPHVLRTRRYQAAALAACPDEGVQRALAAILFDEYGRSEAAESHPQLYREFLIGLDIPQEEWNPEPQLVEVDMYIRSLQHVVQEGPWRFAVGAVGLGGELPIPKLYTGFLGGFGTLEALDDRAREIFRLHVEVDQDHGDLLVNAVSKSARTREHQREFEAGLQYSLDARCVVMDALGRRIGNQVETVD